ncbi:MAG: hypothetical protein ABIT07_11640 [Ferruginibacter sp.]
MRYSFIFSLLACCFISPVQAQLTVSGTVYDNSKVIYVERVQVISTGGMQAVTDSLGRYTIVANEKDSLYFFYNNKPTQKFPVRNIPNLSKFDISLHIAVESKYNVLKEVIVYSKSYKQDSLENRSSYPGIFGYKKPGLSSTISPGGVAGADLDELINIFRFKRNKRLKSFQRRLEEEEQSKYVDYRFNKISVRRITGLAGGDLDSFMVLYRPSYEFASSSGEVIFNQYVLNASYRFKKTTSYSPAKKEE